MFESIIVEEEFLDHPRVLKLVKRFPNAKFKSIDKIDNYFSRVKKPYLQKRESLQLFLGKKRGELVKVAPPAYGLSGEPHYYYVHAYNCIYECEYCYLQGHFDSPDLVWFLNHEEILAEMKKTVESHQEKVWFHAGEFSDSLALSHFSEELPTYHHFFSQNPKALWELRTKSVNIKELMNLSPLKNMFTSFSLSPQEESKKIDLLTPSAEQRIKAMGQLIQAGHQVAAHFDPIIYSGNFIEKYESLLDLIESQFPLHKLHYLSLGVVRFTKDVYLQVQKNYPESIIHTNELVKGADNKIRYTRPMRLWMLSKIKDLCIKRGLQPKKIYLCME